ncbi:MAG: hypothetical protein AAF806_19875 [Bacteroidota bacterium]
MCSANRFLCLVFLFFALYANGQNSAPEFETGIAIAGSEAFYLGGYSKYRAPISEGKNYFSFSIGLTYYFDFRGESYEKSYLKKDVDMRLIPNVFIAYDVNLKDFNFAIEVPIGASIAIARGTLVNERVGFERDYKNVDFLPHFGIGLSARYRLNASNKIGLYGFMDILKDDAWSPPMTGIGWTRVLEVD